MSFQGRLIIRVGIDQIWARLFQRESRGKVIAGLRTCNWDSRWYKLNVYGEADLGQLLKRPSYSPSDRNCHQRMT
jgi:hypothetical protein